MADDVSKVVPFLSVRTVKLATLSVSPETLSESLVAQIPEEALFAADGALNGRIWGTWHSNVVWERNRELRKTPISEAFSGLRRLSPNE